MGPYGELTGNGVGTARMVARWGHSLLDTVIVKVTETEEPREIFRDSLTHIDTLDWRPIGDPLPRPVVLDGEPVLRLMGDEKYTDGLLLRTPIPLDKGVTVEFEFKLAVTEPVHQNLGLCLRDIDWGKSDLESGALYTTGEACIAYPAQEHAKMDPSEVAVVVAPGRELHVEVPDVLPSDDWVHMALQIRADGETSLVVNRQPVGVNPVDLQTDPRLEWHVILFGTVVGTELYMRNLTVWPGERY